MPEPSLPLKLFEAYGVEIEYMIVDRDTLEIRPLADKLLTDTDGLVCNDLVRGEIAWSNELALHLVEFNFTNPEKTLAGKDKWFHKNIITANYILEKYNAMLLPSGMHPFLDPTENHVQLWPHELSEVYDTYDKIFNCKNHGWVNVQSSHLNLPFSTDDEFRKLHAAIRFVLPIIPALAASSPITGGKITGFMDSRLDHYRNNQNLVPEIGADVIPEIIDSPEQYKSLILDTMYAAVSPHDPDGILQDEWLNSRGAIARFDRSTIEIRLIDTQECPIADFAILQIISHLAKWLIEEKKDVFNVYHGFNQKSLVSIFHECVQHGDQTIIENSDYLKILNIDSPAKGKEIWGRLFDVLFSAQEKNDHESFIREYNSNGTLSSRILKAAGENPDAKSITKVYHELSRCLAENKVFTAV
jgi:gamma-glutamyl:cysteine ligase YbdK (ATP-grasp superfamily)